MAKATEIPFEGIDSHPTIGIASRGPSDSSTKGILAVSYTHLTLPTKA